MKKTISLTIIAASAAVMLGTAGVANAGRYIDTRHAAQQAPELGTTTSLHSSGYSGRAVDQPYQARKAEQPTAEFAVMDVGEKRPVDSGITNPANYGGRYTDRIHMRH